MCVQACGMYENTYYIDIQNREALVMNNILSLEKKSLQS